MRSKLTRREFALRFGGSELRQFLARVELREYRAFAHRLAGIECDHVYGARQVRADLDALHGGDCADRAQRRGPMLFGSDDCGDRLGRRLKGGGLSDRRLDLLELYKPKGRDEHCRDSKRENDALCHYSLFRVVV